MDAEAVEAQPHKGACEVASEVRAALDGSRQVNAKKGGAGVLSAVADVAQARAGEKAGLEGVTQSSLRAAAATAQPGAAVGAMTWWCTAAAV